MKIGSLLAWPWLVASFWCAPAPAGADSSSAPPSPVTFNRDIAPIIYRSCAPCHHTGESTPFNLLTYAQVARRARQIVDVTHLGYMPPWPPVTGHGYPALEGARTVTQGEEELIRRWVADGAVEGAPQDLPVEPTFSGEWQLGAPDMVLEMPRTFTMPAAGPDVFRNFVIPIPITERRYVRAIQFRPNSRAAHHAAMEVDLTRRSRMKDAAGQTPGYPGPMSESAVQPAGQFLTWQPGKLASVSPPGMPWILDPGTDLVLDSHLRPTGKVEAVRFKVGLYFTNRPPERTAYRLIMVSLLIDIPPGATNFAVDNSFTLPVNCEALGMLPHAHFLGREIEGHADLPDGTRLPLLLITNWDFNWQGDYRFQTPVKLPRGAVLRIRVTYDNSTNNVRNPNAPPKRVRYGVQSSDEMAELSFLLLTERPEDEKILDAAYRRDALRMMAKYDAEQAAENPNDAIARMKLGQNFLVQGRIAEAKTLLERAIEINPDLSQAHYSAGLIARLQQRWPDARHEFETAVRLDPTDANAWANLGIVRIQLKDLNGARESLRHVLEINPSDDVARGMLEEISR